MTRSPETVSTRTSEHAVGATDSGASGQQHRPRRVAPVQIVATVALVVLLAAFVRVLTAPVDHTIQGDEASFVYNALSLQGGDLSYDAHDQERWLSLGMSDQPVGLFTQANDTGWAVAKPVGYSVVLAPFVWLFGARGIQLVGTMLLVAYACCWYFGLRLTWTRETSLIVTTVVTIGSFVWFYAYPAHADLFVATVVGVVSYGCLRAALRSEPVWLWIGACAAGLLITEKVPAFLALTPVLAVAASRIRRRHALIGLIALLTTGALTTIPYLYYSDGASWSAYGGERYSVATTTPWSGGTVEDLHRVRTDEVITMSYVREHLVSPSPDIPDATVSYLVGRHTGMMTFMPIMPPLIVASMAALVRRRGKSRPDDAGTSDDTFRTPQLDGAGRDQLAATIEAGEGAGGGADPSARRGAPSPALAWAGVASLVLYIGFYVVLFTNLYYGGFHSVGNRYFLQFSATAMIVPIAGGLSEHAAMACAGIAAVWAVVVLGPHLAQSDVMFREFWHTSAVQRLLPYDGTQIHSLGTWSGEPDLVALSGPWEWKGDETFSQTGTIVGESIEARAGRDPAGFVTVGPYIDMAAGTYRARIVYSCDIEPTATNAQFVAAVVGVTAAETDLVGTSGRVVTATIDFEVTSRSGWEFRSWWDGTGEFTVRSIRVERLDTD